MKGGGQGSEGSEPHQPVSSGSPQTPNTNKILSSVGEAPMVTVQQTFRLLECGMCRKLFGQLDTHHAIPRYLGGNNEDTIQVCKSCHKKADIRFDTLILDPFEQGRGKDWYDPDKAKRYANEYNKRYNKGLKRHQLYSIIIEKGVRYCVRILAYTDKELISISGYWSAKK